MKTRRMLSFWGTATALATTLVVSGCGGGDDSPPPAPTSQVPATASQSVAGFIGYLQALVVSSADTLEPVDTSMVTAPTDDTIEPVQVD